MGSGAAAVTLYQIFLFSFDVRWARQTVSDNVRLLICLHWPQVPCCVPDENIS
jgi:hypothetical protein